MIRYDRDPHTIHSAVLRYTLQGLAQPDLEARLLSINERLRPRSRRKSHRLNRSWVPLRCRMKRSRRRRRRRRRRGFESGKRLLTAKTLWPKCRNTNMSRVRGSNRPPNSQFESEPSALFLFSSTLVYVYDILYKLLYEG